MPNISKSDLKDMLCRSVEFDIEGELEKSYTENLNERIWPKKFATSISSDTVMTEHHCPRCSCKKLRSLPREKETWECPDCELEFCEDDLEEINEQDLTMTDEEKTDYMVNKTVRKSEEKNPIPTIPLDINRKTVVHKGRQCGKTAMYSMIHNAKMEIKRENESNQAEEK